MPPEATAFQSCILCTAPRSGSTLLCSLLTATGVAGKPASYFYDPSVAEWQADLGLEIARDATELDRLRAVVTEVLHRGRAGTGVFALRQQAGGRDFLLGQLALLAPQARSDAHRIEAVFGRTLYVHLTRDDKLDQAVSLLRARQTGLWHGAPDGSDLERNAPHLPPGYDAAAIRDTIADLTAQDDAWTDWFAGEGINPLHLTYDAVSGHPLAVVRRVLTALGLDPKAANGITPGTRKLADGTNQAWVRRFRAETAG